MNKLLFIFMLFPNMTYAQSGQKSALNIDTVFLSKGIAFTSDLEGKISACLGQEFYETDSFTLKRANGTIALFNRELKTKIFKKIKIITASCVKVSETENWITAMEWHFQNEAESIKIEKKLKELDGGIIRYPIVPVACYFVRSGNKIYVIRYGPRKGGNKVVEDFFSCLKSSIK